MDQVEITAGRLHLRPPVLGDWPDIHTARLSSRCARCSLDQPSSRSAPRFARCSLDHRDPEIQQWTSVPSPYSEGDAQSFVADFAPVSWRTGRRATFAVCDATSGQLLAMCDLGHLGITRASVTWASGALRGPAARALPRRRPRQCAAGASPSSGWPGSSGTPRRATSRREGLPRRWGSVTKVSCAAGSSMGANGSTAWVGGLLAADLS